MARVELSDGAWVELRDPESVTNREKFEYKRRTIPGTLDRVAREQGCTVGEVGVATASGMLVDAVLSKMITAWSFDLPIPSDDPEVWNDDRFPFEEYDKLTDAVGPLVRALQGVAFDAKKQESGSGPDRTTPTETSAA